MTTQSDLDRLFKSVYTSALPKLFPSRPTPWYRRIKRWLKGEAWRDTAREYDNPFARVREVLPVWGSNRAYWDIVTKKQP